MSNVKEKHFDIIRYKNSVLNLISVNEDTHSEQYDLCVE